MLPFLKSDMPLKILDIGCNTGYFSLKANKLGHEVLGIDIDKNCIEFANKTIEEENLKDININLLENDLLDHLKTFKDNSFDYVFYLSVHHHIFKQYNIKIAKGVLKEISRIGRNMFFDMGQTDEKDNGYLTWKPYIPKMTIPEKSIIGSTLMVSNFKYGEILTSTTIHETERLFFIFNKELPSSLTLKELTINNKKYYIDKYMWKDVGSCGTIYTSSDNFPAFTFDMESRTRFYITHDSEGKEFFIKERKYSQLQDNTSFVKLEYDRGQKIKHIEHTLPALEYENNFLVFPYYTIRHIGNCFKAVKNIPLKLRESIFNTTKEIDKVLNGFDFNINNILYKDGAYKIIDFEPAKSGNMAWDEKLDHFKHYLKLK